jgi:thioredoxin 1
MQDLGTELGCLTQMMAAHYLLNHVQVKLNTDDSPGVATEYGIRSIPTIMLFKGGKRLDTIIGAVPKENLMKTITKIVT